MQPTPNRGQATDLISLRTVSVRFFRPRTFRVRRSSYSDPKPKLEAGGQVDGMAYTE